MGIEQDNGIEKPLLVIEYEIPKVFWKFFFPNGLGILTIWNCIRFDYPTKVLMDTRAKKVLSIKERWRDGRVVRKMEFFLSKR